MNEPAPTAVSNELSNVKLIYILYLASILLGITSLIGLIMAYVNKNGDTGVANNHYRYQIRTFWIGFLYAIICGLTMMIGIGVLLMFVLLVWFIVRCVKGLKAAGENREVENVASWLF